MGIREQLYYAVEHYLRGEYSTPLFCDVYYDIFYPDQPIEYLSPKEFYEFSKLAEVISRYSQYSEDHENCPNAFSDDKEVLQTAKNVLKNLQVSNI